MRELIAKVVCILIASAAFSSISSGADDVRIPLQLTTGCAETQTRREQLCLSPGLEVSTAKIDEKSRNGSSDAVWTFDPANKNCVVVTLHARGLGEDCLKFPFGNRICNCRGRGWINVDVTLTPKR